MYAPGIELRASVSAVPPELWPPANSQPQYAVRTPFGINRYLLSIKGGATLSEIFSTYTVYIHVFLHVYIYIVEREDWCLPCTERSLGACYSTFRWDTHMGNFFILVNFGYGL